MRRRSVVATAALIAAGALAGLPGVAGSAGPSIPRDPAPEAFSEVVLPGDPAPAVTLPDASLRSAGYLSEGAVLLEAGRAPSGPAARPKVDQPLGPVGQTWKPARYSMQGYATFYDNGTTAMRLKRGTVIRVCGAGGCLERTINDYGPWNFNQRIIDLYRPDFFRICGCGWWSGTTWVTVWVY